MIGGRRPLDLLRFRGGPSLVYSRVQIHMCLRLGPDGRAFDKEPQLSVEIEGTPSLQATFSSLDHSAVTGQVLDLNSARLVNLLPLLRQALPGFRNILELPFVTSHQRASSSSPSQRLS